MNLPLSGLLEALVETRSFLSGRDTGSSTDFLFALSTTRGFDFFEGLSVFDDLLVCVFSLSLSLYPLFQRVPKTFQASAEI
jgi:hypothetical protein